MKLHNDQIGAGNRQTNALQNRIAFQMLESRSVSLALAEFESLPSPQQQHPIFLDSLIGILFDRFSAKLSVQSLNLLHRVFEYGSVEQPRSELNTNSVQQAILNETFQYFLASSWATVRIAAIEAVKDRRLLQATSQLHQIVSKDSSWIVRRSALRGLIQFTDVTDVDALTAATDPHWRVRHALLQELEKKIKNLNITEINTLFQNLANDLFSRQLCKTQFFRYRGMIEYLHFSARQTNRENEIAPLSDIDSIALSNNLTNFDSVDGVNDPASPQHLDPLLAFDSPLKDPEAWCDFWDWDPAVLTRNLQELGDEGRDEKVDIMANLISHGDDRVQQLAADALYRVGNREQLHKAFEILKRTTSRRVLNCKESLFQLDEPRREKLDIRSGQLDSLADFGKTECNPHGKIDSHGKRDSYGEFSPQHPISRIQSLTPEIAATIVEYQNETSWPVLRQAARIQRIPLWSLALRLYPTTL